MGNDINDLVRQLAKARRQAAEAKQKKDDLINKFQASDAYRETMERVKELQEREDIQ